MTIKSTVKERIHVLMADGKPRTNTAIAKALNLRSASSIDVQALKLVDEKYLKIANIVAFSDNKNVPRIFQLRVREDLRQGTNPFEWQTYRQWEPA